MTLTSQLPRLLRLRLPAVLGLSLSLLVTPLFAGKIYLGTKDVDGLALLPPPPALDSGEQLADLAALRAVASHRTAEELEGAERDEDLSIYRFSEAIGRDFVPGKYPKLEILLETVKTNVNGIIYGLKSQWQRPRPYVADPLLLQGAPERSFSYPSGHSTRGTLLALVVAEVFPERSDEVLAFGQKLGWDRAVLGKHYPTDINAGRVLGREIFRVLMRKHEFRRDLWRAKAQVKAAGK